MTSDASISEIGITCTECFRDFLYKMKENSYRLIFPRPAILTLQRSDTFAKTHRKKHTHRNVYIRWKKECEKQKRAAPEWERFVSNPAKSNSLATSVGPFSPRVGHTVMTCQEHDSRSLSLSRKRVSIWPRGSESAAKMDLLFTCSRRHNSFRTMPVSRPRAGYIASIWRWIHGYR